MSTNRQTHRQTRTHMTENIPSCSAIDKKDTNNKKKNKSQLQINKRNTNQQNLRLDERGRERERQTDRQTDRES